MEMHSCSLVSLKHPLCESWGWCEQLRSRFTQGSGFVRPPRHRHFIPHLSHLSSPTRLPLSAPPSFSRELFCPLNGPRSPSRQTILLHHCQPHQCSRDNARKELHLFQPSPPDIYLSPVPLGHSSTLPCSVKISQCLLGAHSESLLLSLLSLLTGSVQGFLITAWFSAYAYQPCLVRALTSGVPWFLIP